MKIAIDASRAINEKAGIGRYTYQLVDHMLKTDQKNQYLLIFSYFRKNQEKEKTIKKFEKYKNVKTKIIKIPGRLKETVWLWKWSPYKKIYNQSDVILAPSCFEVNLALKIPQAVVIYDLTTILFPEHQGINRAKSYSLRILKTMQHAKKIITISQSTKNDLIKIAKIPESKIKVVYPGLTKFVSIASKLPRGIKPKQYILSVGTIEPRKNLINLFKAYAKLSIDYQKKYPLVVVGAKGWNTSDIYQTIETENLQDKVRFLGFQSDESLAKLYSEAKVFIYPSLYEGFGLPVAEAMQFKTPVIISNISSLPEVGGKAATYIDPNHPKSIKKAIENHLENRIDIEKNAKIGLEHIKRFSWKNNAKKTISILENLVK